jgi:uncharacterized protein
LLAFDGSSDDAPEETAAAMQPFMQRHTYFADQTGFDEDDFSKLLVKTRLVVTRGQDAAVKDRLEFLREVTPISFPVLTVELDDPASREALRNDIVAALDLIRLYTKTPGKPADYSSPFTLPVGGTVEDLAGKIHRDLSEKVKSAKVWAFGNSDSRTVGKDHVLADRDLVELQT